MLYEDQIKRGLTGAYPLKPPPAIKQIELPLEKPSRTQFSASSAENIRSDETDLPKIDLSAEEIALLGIISELPTRYSPDSLTASIESQTRVGLAGWIIDTRLGEDAEPDEETIKQTISDLCGRELIEVTDTRRLKATSTGKKLWETLK